MKTRSRFKLIIEDERRLENLASISAPGYKWLLGGGGVFFAIMSLGALLVFLSPARRLLPGYLKESERSATEMQLIRLDSLRNAYEVNAAFIKNLQNVLNPSAFDQKSLYPSSPSAVADSINVEPKNSPFHAEAILSASPDEIKFAAMMRNREKYNVSIVAPLAAESMMFSPLNEAAVFSMKSREATKAEVILPVRSSISSIADGTVISVSQSVKNGGSSVIIQHPKGFLSRISRLGTVIVEPGDNITGGQIIAFTNQGNARKGESVNLELWHNGDPLIPYNYIGVHSGDPRPPLISPGFP